MRRPVSSTMTRVDCVAFLRTLSAAERVLALAQSDAVASAAIVSTRPIIFRVCIELRKVRTQNKKAPRDKWGRWPRPFSRRAMASAAGAGFLTLSLSALRLLLVHACDGNSGAARSAIAFGTILPGLNCAACAIRASGRLTSAAPADHSGGTVADFHGLPVPPASSNFQSQSKRRGARCQMRCF
jgi:hypothetical protein